MLGLKCRRARRIPTCESLHLPSVPQAATGSFRSVLSQTTHSRQIYICSIHSTCSSHRIYQSTQRPKCSNALNAINYTREGAIWSGMNSPVSFPPLSSSNNTHSNMSMTDGYNLSASCPICKKEFQKPYIPSALRLPFK